MLHKVFQASAGPLYPLICANFLSTKLVAMMVKAFLYRLLDAFLTSSFVVDGGGNFVPSMISQRSLVDNTISNLNL